MMSWLASPLIHIPVENFPQNVVDQRTFAAAADSCDTDEGSEWEGNADVFQVVVSRPEDFDRLTIPGPALCGDGDLASA